MAESARLIGMKDRWNKRARCRDNVLYTLFDGTGYLTIGYYLTGDETVGESARNMTARLAEISDITENSRVLDLGCGTGAPALDIALQTGATVVGVDIADGHIEMANEYLANHRVDHPEIQAEFHAGSYYDIPSEVKALAPFTHVIMQTSIFYAHHRIDEVLEQVSSVLVPGSGLLVTTDFLRKAPLSEVSEFLDMNSMSTVLSKDEMEAALKRNGMEYTGGEVLDSHCVKCNIAKRKKVESISLQGPESELFGLKFKTRENFVRDGKISFQIVIASKK